MRKAIRIVLAVGLYLLAANVMLGALQTLVAGISYGFWMLTVTLTVAQAALALGFVCCALSFERAVFWPYIRDIMASFAVFFMMMVVSGLLVVSGNI